jgi:CDP-diglyceride synthetase
MVAIKKQKEALAKTKEKGSDSGKKSNVLKRMWTALWCGSWYVTPMFFGAFYFMINCHIMGMLMYREAMNLYYKANKRRVNTGQYLLNWIVYWTFSFRLAPMCYLRREILTNSGFSKQDYPVLHEILY